MCLSNLIKTWLPPVDAIDKGWGYTEKSWTEKTTLYKVAQMRGDRLYPLIHEYGHPFVRGVWQKSVGDTTTSNDGPLMLNQTIPLGFHCLLTLASAKRALAEYESFGLDSPTIIECRMRKFVALGYQAIIHRLGCAELVIVGRELILPAQGLTFDEEAA